MKHRINESQSKQQLIDLIKDSIYTADKQTQRDIILPDGYLETVCKTIVDAKVVENCEWVRSTFVQFSKSAHANEANHYEPRTVMHFMNNKHEPAFDIVLNFGYKYDQRDPEHKYYFSKKILFGMPPSEKLEGHKSLNDLLTDFNIKCVEVAEYYNENDFVKRFASDYRDNIVLNKPATADDFIRELQVAIIYDAKYYSEFYADYDESWEITLDDIRNDSEGNVDDVIRRADEAGINIFDFMSEKQIIDAFVKCVQQDSGIMDEKAECTLTEVDDSLTEAETNREQINNLVQVLLAEFNKAEWDSLELAFGKDNEISIIPKFAGDEKNESTVKDFIVKVNGKIAKNLCAQTVERLARQLADFRNNLNDPKISLTVKLVGVTYSGANGKENIQDNIRACKKGDAVKLVRIKNTHAYADIDAKDETAVEVRTMDNKALGYLPSTLIEKDRIARKLVQHKPYTAKVYTKLGGFKGYETLGIVITLDFED